MKTKSKTPPTAYTERREKIRQALRFGNQYSDRYLAKRIGTSHVTVAKVRNENPNYAKAETIGLDGVSRRRPTKGNLREFELAWQRLETTIKRLRDGLERGQDSKENAQARNHRLIIKSRIKEVTISFNTLVTPLVES